MLTKLIVPLQPNGQKPRLFCVHPVEGDVFCYYELTKALGKDYPVFCIQAQGLNKEESLHQSLDEMAQSYTAAIQTLQPQGPYYLAGWSAGGVISLQIAKLLEQQGHSISLLVIIDSPDPDDLHINEHPLKFYLGLFNKRLQSNIHVSDDEFQELEFDAILKLILQRSLEAGLYNREIAFPDFKRRVEIFLNNCKLIKEYRPHKYQSVKNILLFEALIKDVTIRKITMETFGHLEKIDLPCTHFTIMKTPHVIQIAGEIKKYIV